MHNSEFGRHRNVYILYQYFICFNPKLNFDNIVAAPYNSQTKHQGALLLTWININPGMDEKLHVE